MKLQRLAGAMAAGLMALTACSQGDSASEGTAEAAGTNERIVVLDLGALDTVNALGEADRVVGIPKATPLPDSLSTFESDDIADVGGLKEPDIEAIASLDPDLVITGPRTADLTQELSQHFETLDVTYDQNKPFVEGASEATLKIAEALDKTEEAEAKLEEFNTAVEDAKAGVPEGATALVVMSSGGKISAMNPSGRYALIYNDLGFTPAIESVKEGSHGDPISFEGIQKADPDYLFVLDRDAAIGETGGEAAEQILDNPLIHETKAWKNDQVVYLDGPSWYIMMHGLDNMFAMLEDVTIPA